MSNSQKNIFFIASWFPSKDDEFLGDFILRHAQAIGLQHKVTVVFAIECNLFSEKIKIETEENNNLKIIRIYIASTKNKFIYYQQIQKIFTQENTKNK